MAAPPRPPPPLFVLLCLVPFASADEKTCPHNYCPKAPSCSPRKCCAPGLALYGAMREGRRRRPRRRRAAPAATAGPSAVDPSKNYANPSRSRRAAAGFAGAGPRAPQRDVPAPPAPPGAPVGSARSPGASSGAAGRAPTAERRRRDPERPNIGRIDVGDPERPNIGRIDVAATEPGIPELDARASLRVVRCSSKAWGARGEGSWSGGRRGPDDESSPRPWGGRGHAAPRTRPRSSARKRGERSAAG